MVMLWTQAWNEKVTALPVTAAQTRCTGKCFSLNLTERARSQGNLELRLGGQEAIGYGTKVFGSGTRCSSPPVRIPVGGDTVRTRWRTRGSRHRCQSRNPLGAG